MTNDVLNGYVCPTCEGVGCPDCHKTGVRQDRRKIAEVVGSNPTPSTTPTDEFSEGVKISIMHGDRELGNFTLHDTVAKHLIEGKEIEGYIGGFDDSIPCFTAGNFYKREPSRELEVTKDELLELKKQNKHLFEALEKSQQFAAARIEREIVDEEIHSENCECCGNFLRMETKADKLRSALRDISSWDGNITEETARNIARNALLEFHQTKIEGGK